MQLLKKLVCLLFAGALLLSVSGCSGKSEPPISVGIPDDIVSLDCAGTKDVISETVARCVYSTLYTFDENLQLSPCLAESGERVSDLEWVFQLRKGVKFHDGTPLTAEDVKFSIERAMTIELAEKSLLIIDRLEAPDESTLRVFTKEPCADLPQVFVRVSTSVMSKKALENPNYNFNKPVGSGPFQVLERKEGEALRLQRFDQYFLEPAKTKYLTFIVEASEQNRTAGLLDQTLDVLFRVSSYDCDYLKLNDNVKVYEKDSTKMELISFNPDAKPLEDIRVREAIAHAINKQNIVDNVLDGYGQPLNSMIPPPISGAVDFDGFAYDPARSKQLLAEAGYPDGFELSVITFDELRKKLMDYLKLDLAQVGIRLNYEFYDLQSYLDIIENNQHMASAMSWTSNADPDGTFSQIYSKSGHPTINQSKFSDPRVETLILQGKQESDPLKRQRIYEEANRIVAESYFILPLYQPQVFVAAGKSIGGVRINPQGIFGYESLYRIEDQ